jgi:serine/threonine-protein kinase
MRWNKGMARFSLAASLMVGAAAMARANPACAQAAPSSSDKVAAEALFQDGRKLVADGKYAEACPKFADSQRLDPSPGTLLNLANCYDKLGRTATAWATYREAASAANAAGRSDYVATAERHASALEPKLSRLTVSVAQPVEGMQVARDGVLVPRGAWGTAMPVDPGPHDLTASAPGYKGWVSSVTVAPDASRANVTVPALEALPPEALPVPSPAPSPASVPQPTEAPVEPPPGFAETGASRGSGQRILGVVFGGLGIVGLGVGTAFALSAKSKYDDSLNACETANHDLCNPTGISQRNDARSAGDAATVAFGLGAAALVAGGILWFTAPRASAAPRTGSASLVVAPTLGGAVVKGAF